LGGPAITFNHLADAFVPSDLCGEQHNVQNKRDVQYMLFIILL